MEVAYQGTHLIFLTLCEIPDGDLKAREPAARSVVHHF